MYRNNIIKQRQAKISDSDRIKQFLDEDVLVHKHLDWKEPLAWIGSDGFLIDETDDEISGVLVCTHEEHGGAWIRMFAAPRMAPLEVTWKRLWKSYIDIAQTQPLENVASLSFSNWYCTLLENITFRHTLDIVFFEHNDPTALKIYQSPGIYVREMESTDLEVVEQIDHSAFSHMWQVSRQTIEGFLGVDGYSSIAMMNGQIVGYQASSVFLNKAHINRIAINPQFQNKHIGTTLLGSLFEHLTLMGVTSISVNTQSNNSASLALYQRSGFRLQDNKIPVLEQNFNQLRTHLAQFES